MTERHTASPLPHSKAMELQNDPSTHWCLRHSPMSLMFPMDHSWLEHCCKPTAHGWSVRPSWKVKEGRNTQTVPGEGAINTHWVPQPLSLSLSLSPLPFCISHTTGARGPLCQRGERSSDLDESTSSHIFHPLTNHFSCTAHVPIHHR